MKGIAIHSLTHLAINGYLTFENIGIATTIVLIIGYLVYNINSYIKHDNIENNTSNIN